MDKEKVRKYLSVIRRAVSLVEAELELDLEGEELVEEFSQFALPKERVYKEVQVAKDVEHIKARKQHIEDLMAIKDWPEVVPNNVIEQISDKDQKKRAISAIDAIVDRSLEGVNFLDFGCGEGWITQEVVRRGAANVVGYDIVANAKWKDLHGPFFTNDINLLKKNHFDVIFLYDVLDHCVDPVQVMTQVGNCLKKDGVIYVRCHPWTSRHATHVFKQGLNKSYIHLFLTWDEIKELTEQEPVFTRAEKNPITSYRWWFNDFKIVKERLREEVVHAFFHNPSFKELLAQEQNLDNVDAFLDSMKLQFVDYVLACKQ